MFRVLRLVLTKSIFTYFLRPILSDKMSDSETGGGPQSTGKVRYILQG